MGWDKNMKNKICKTCLCVFTRGDQNKTWWSTAQFCSQSCRGKNNEWKLKSSLAHKGKHSSPNTEFKTGSLVGLATRFTKEKVSGEKSYNWKGGVTTINEQIRKSSDYKVWRKHVFTRDDYTCQACGVRGSGLEADHELPFALFPDLRFEVLNGRTFCKPCHRKTPTYGDRKASEILHMFI